MDSDSSMWIILAVVLVIFFFIVVIIGVGLTIFFIARRRKKQALTAKSGLAMSDAAVVIPSTGGSFSDRAATAPAPEPFSPTPEPEKAIAPEALASPPAAEELDFDPSRTVAINRENTVTISYGTIKFISGVLAGQQFDVNPEGSYIGRESSLSQIVVSDPRISKRHLWIGVRDGLVKIVDQGSRNGTFVNDPKSERVSEATLNPGDTVILGESDVARFEYNM